MVTVPVSKLAWDAIHSHAQPLPSPTPVILQIDFATHPLGIKMWRDGFHVMSLLFEQFP
jgi:hypothetical protein